MNYRLWTILIALFPMIGTGAVINTNDWQVRSTYPTRIGGTYNPSIEILRDAGWREYVPCAGVEGSNIVSTTYSDDGDTVTASCEYAEAIPYVEPPAEFPAGIISGGRIVAQGVDIEATTPDTGYILTDANTNKWLVTIADGEVIGVQISASPEISMEERRAAMGERRQAAQAERRQRQAALRVSRMTAQATITNETELIEIADLFAEWQSGMAVSVGDLYRFNGDLYRVIQGHTTQADWTPPQVPALFVRVAAPGVIAPWVQPAGAHDAYQIGDRVTHNGFTWISTVANNVWAPGVYGWNQE
jgi:hypothetical protein